VNLPGLVFRQYDLDSPDNRDPELIDALCGLINSPLRRYFRSEVRGLDRIPKGPGLYVGNHNGGLLTADSFIFGGAVYETHGMDEMPYGLGHELTISLPVIHQFVMPIGAIRASHENAHRLFERGAKVLVYPGGDMEAMRPWRDRNRIVFDGRVGYVRLALRARVPIIPVVAVGAHETFLVLDDMRWLSRLLGLDRFLRVGVWPLTLSVPWGLTVGPPPPYFPLRTQILIEVLKPIRFRPRGRGAENDKRYVRQCANRVEKTMQSAMDRLSAERRDRSSPLGKRDPV